MLDDGQHQSLKILIKRAIDGNSDDRRHAIEDAAHILCVVSDKRFVRRSMMKAGRKAGRCSEEEFRQDAENNAQECINKFGPNSPHAAKSCVR